MNIGFIYYNFYPITGGASVHGFHLAKELSGLGHSLYKLNGESDPFTTKMKNPVWGLIWILLKCDILYVRMDFFINFRNCISLIGILFGKKVVVELNSPSDELHLFGKSEAYIKNADTVMKFILKRVNAIIVISEPIKKYCEQTLGLTNVYLIENGADYFNKNVIAPSEKIRKQITEIRNDFSKIVLWSGSVNQMQNLSLLKNVIIQSKNEIAFVIITGGEGEKSIPIQKENLFFFKDLKREDVMYIMTQSDIGLAFYREYSWSRWGFYNSSLKLYEYLNNGLTAITNINGSDYQNNHKAFIKIDNVDDAIISIEKAVKLNSHQSLRTWNVVAKQTDAIFKLISSSEQR